MIHALATHLTKPRDLVGPALRSFLKLGDLWGLSPAEQRILLGDTPKATYQRWKKEPPSHLSHDTLERISYLLGIYKALQILIPNQSVADAWIRQPNDDPLFGGKAPLERMLGGKLSDLWAVRRYLDAARGVW